MSRAETVIGAFTAEQVVRLTGLTLAQLGYWDRTGFFAPEYATQNRRSAYARMYSFRDVVGLRTLSVLKGRHGVSLRHLRDVAKRLAAYSKSPWADIKLKVWNGKVHFDEPESGKTRDVVEGQFVLFPLSNVLEEVGRGIDEMRTRETDQIGRFERHRSVAHNAPVIAGTRIPVAAILRFIKANYSAAQIIAEYPILKEADILTVSRADTSILAA